MTGERKAEIDIAKGFAIFVVIMYHTFNRDETVFRWIMMFSLPVFFFLTGMTFRPEKYSNLSGFMRERGYRRILTYLLVVAGGFLYCMLRPDYRIPILEDGWYYQLKYIFWYARPMDLYIGQVWYLAALFFAELFAWIWFKVLGGRSAAVRAWSLVIIAYVGVHIGRIFPYLPVGDRLPWKTDSAIVCTVFIICGYYAARAHLAERLAPYASFVVPFSFLLTCYFGPMQHTYVNIADCAYNSMPLYYLGAFSGITMLVVLAYASRNPVLSHLHAFWRFWQFCGRYSLQLFIGQTFAIYFWVEMIERFTGIIIVPNHTSPGNIVSFGIAAASLLLMLAFLYPWYRWRCKRSLEGRNGR